MIGQVFEAYLDGVAAIWRLAVGLTLIACGLPFFAVGYVAALVYVSIRHGWDQFRETVSWIADA